MGLWRRMKVMRVTFLYETVLTRRNLLVFLWKSHFWQQMLPVVSACQVNLSKREVMPTEKTKKQLKVEKQRLE